MLSLGRPNEDHGSAVLLKLLGIQYLEGVLHLRENTGRAHVGEHDQNILS